MNSREYQAQVKVELPDESETTATYTVKDADSKSEVRRKLANHFGLALLEVKKIIEGRNGGNGGAGGTLAIA